MQVDTLDELKFAFAKWRSKKRHVREPMPEELLARARRATEKHGLAAVVHVTQVERARMFRARPARTKERAAMSTKPEGLLSSVPPFSRLELSASSAPSRGPIAEVETGSGVTLRVFEQTPQMLGLLSAVCGFGGVR